ncbi:hypothetical protein SRABI106_04379 [Rahnella aquatilis]|nr:hypothetical protein SRABI106_04379 [Rahnella aquatilis]
MCGIKEGTVAEKIQIHRHTAIGIDQITFGFHFLIIVGAAVYRRPDRHHSFDAQRFKLRDHGFRIRPVHGVKTPGALIRPVEEVDDNHRNRQIAPPVFTRHLQHFLLRTVAQFALPETGRVFRHLRRSAGRAAILMQDVSGLVSGGDPVIHLLRDLRFPAGNVFAECRLANRRIVPQHAVTQA